jgi:hypothetical protein
MVEGSGTLDIVNGGMVSRPKAKSVTHVSGTACHVCLRPLIPIPRRTSPPFCPRRLSGERKGAGAAPGIGTKAPIEHGAAGQPPAKPIRGCKGNYSSVGDTRHAMPSAPRRHCAMKPLLYRHLARWCTICPPASAQSHRVVPCNHRPTSVGESRRSADIGRKKAATKQLV